MNRKPEEIINILSTLNIELDYIRNDKLIINNLSFLISENESLPFIEYINKTFNANIEYLSTIFGIKIHVISNNERRKNIISKI